MPKVAIVTGVSAEIDEAIAKQLLGSRYEH
jgi:NADP-dependent 3-hydroxy acid dehydrogenase YdfG